MTIATHQATTKKHWVAHERKQGPPLKYRNDVAVNTKQPANRSAHALSNQLRTPRRINQGMSPCQATWQRWPRPCDRTQPAGRCLLRWHDGCTPCKPRCSIPIVCSARKMADTAAFSAIVYHVFGQEGPCQHANRVTFRPKPVETVRFPLQTRVSANPHLINLIHDACFCGSIGHFFCFAQSSWRDCGTVVGSVPWIPFFVSGRPGNTGMRHALPTTPSYGPTLSHDASR